MGRKFPDDAFINEILTKLTLCKTKQIGQKSNHNPVMFNIVRTFYVN